MKPGSQNDRLLDVLRRGPATNARIHDEAGHMIVNSRVAELRALGYEIRCEYLGGKGATAFLYTLLSERPEKMAGLGQSSESASAGARSDGRSESIDSSGERAVSHAEEEGPRSPTPAAGGPDAQEPGMGARTLAPSSSRLSSEEGCGERGEYIASAEASIENEALALSSDGGDDLKIDVGLHQPSLVAASVTDPALLPPVTGAQLPLFGAAA